MSRAALIALVGSLAAAGADARCPDFDKVTQVELGRAAPARSEARQPLRDCARHTYAFPLRAGQRLELTLVANRGAKAVLSVIAPSGRKLAQEKPTWSGAADESGIYKAEVTTDRQTTYTIKMLVR